MPAARRQPHRQRTFARGATWVRNSLGPCLLLAWILASVPGCSSRTSTGFQALDLDGKLTTLDSGPKGTACVFVFLGVECPIANRCLPELVALETELGPQGVRFHHIYPNADETPEAIHRHRAEYGLNSAAYRDPTLGLARTLGASKTPEAVALSSNGELIYQGRINDQFAALGIGKPEPTRHDLADALRGFLRGAPHVGRGPPAVGCSFRALP
ncbi:MAG: redoxin domain-containing protein [Verrucomicrobiales bacterium]|nr:redoxin domain-containing protein [Verrucomicrobiales bacterium]